MNERMENGVRLHVGKKIGRRMSLCCAVAVAASSWASALAAPPDPALKKKGIEVRVPPDGGAKPMPAEPIAPPNKPVKPEDVKGPHAIIKPDEETHDFGTRWVGPPLKHSFKITNDGDAPLEITRVKPSCGCTIAGDYPKTLAPGASGDFPFSMASNKLRGHFEKFITISSNDPVTPELRLRLKGEMKRYVDVTPPSANFAKITSQETQERVVNITNNTDNPLKLTLVEPAVGKFKAEVIEKTPGKQFDLRITALPPFEPGNLRTTFTMKTNIPEQAEVTVDVNGMVPDRLEVQPAIVTVNPTPNAEQTTGIARVVRFTNYGKDPVKVLEATVDDPAVTVNVSERKAGESYTVQVQMPAGYTPPENGSLITLKTDDKEKATITVPIQSSMRVRTIKQSDAEVNAQLPKPADQPAPSIKPVVPQPAPEFKLTTVDGKEVSNASLKGSVAVLDFFAPNCGYCKKQIPRLETIRAEYADKGVRFINVSQKMGAKEFTQEEVVDMMKQMGFRGELAINHANDVGQMFQAKGFPTMVVLDKEGKIAVTNIGNLADLEDRMKKQLNALIEGKPVPAEVAAAPQQPKQPGPEAMVGKPAPAIGLTTVDGKDLNNASFAQAPATVLDFFAVNCGFCIKQIPRLETVRQKYAEKGIRFVAVQETMRQEFSKEDAQKKLDEIGWKGEWAQDPGNKTGPAFGARGFPTMVIVNKSGMIEAVNVGNLADLETKVPAQLDAILAGKPASTVASATPPTPSAEAKPAAPAKRPAELLVGTAAPTFSLQTVSGKSLTSDEFSKHPATVLNFVAPNCGFCKKQVPNVDKVRAEYEAKGIRFVNVAQKMGSKEYTVEETVDVFKQAGSNLEIAKDEGNTVGQSFKAVSYPTMVVVGKDGKIEHVNIGAKPDLETLLKGQLDGLIAKK